MGAEIVRRAGRFLDAVDVVVPVPTTPVRQRKRGYNQADVIARSVARSLGRPVAPALIRPTAARSQTTIGPSGRLANVKDAFHLEADPQKMLEGRRVLLVDDVITTGATLGAATNALAPAAPASILAVAFARRVPMAHPGGVPR